MYKFNKTINAALQLAFNENDLFGTDFRGYKYVTPETINKCNNLTLNDSTLSKFNQDAKILLKIPLILQWQKFKFLCESEENVNIIFPNGNSNWIID